MSAPRIIVAGATTAITRRTSFRKAFLAPWHPAVQQVWLYALAYAQRETGMAVHMGQCVVNHHHLDVTPTANNLPRFTQLLHHDISRALNALLLAERYETPGELFDGRSAHYMRLLDAETQALHLVYEYTNCVAAGLVSRPEHMPGHVLDFEMWKRGPVEIRRPDVYFNRRNRPDTLPLELTPPPLLYEAFDGDMDRLVYHMQRKADRATQRYRATRSRPPLGARAVSRLHPWSEPRSSRESPGERVPTFKIAGQTGQAHSERIAAANEVRGFRQAHRAARREHTEGSPRALFPHGTWGARVRDQLRVAPQPPEARVAAVGPLLCDVKARLKRRASEGGGATTGLPGAARDVITAVEVALDGLAGEVCEEAMASVDYAPPPPDPTPRPRQASAAGNIAVDNEAGATRVVVLRDRRRGRPARGAGRHGCDPPR